MTVPFEAEAGHAPCTRIRVSLVHCLLAFTACVGSPEELAANSKQQDAVQSAAPPVDTASAGIRGHARRSDDVVEIELQSDGPFNYGAMPPVLIIGDKAFWRSRFAADGSLNTLIFVVDATDFDALNSAAPVSFGYLDPSADFEPPPRGASRLAKVEPMRPDQVKEPRRIGTLRRDRMEISQ